MQSSFDPWQFFECYHIFLCHFLLIDQKTSNHQLRCCSLLFRQSEQNILRVIFWLHLSQMNYNTKILLTWLLKIHNQKTGFVSRLILLIDICSSWLLFSILILVVLVVLFCVELKELLLKYRFLYLLLEMFLRVSNQW